MKRTERLKVLFVTSSYPRHAEDTASVFLRYMAEHLRDLDVEIQIIAPADCLEGSAHAGDVPVHRFRYFPQSFQGLAYGSGMLPNLKRSPKLWLQVPFFMLAMTVTLCRLLRKERFDIIHAHWVVPAGLVGMIASKLFHVPLVVSVHGTDAFTLKGKCSTAIKKRILRNCAAWTANTQRTGQAISPDPAVRKPEIIPMGVDIDRFSGGDGSSLRRKVPTGEFLLLFVGRLIESKGCEDLLRALAMLECGLLRPVNLWIVGEGEQRGDLEELVRNLQLETRVRFLGAVPQQHLPDFYAAADLVVIPSRIGIAGEEEGQSVVALEAFAARVCVLATSCGGLPSIIQPGISGALVAPANPAALASAIDSLLQQPGLRAVLAANAFAQLAEHYSWNRIALEFARLYQKVARRRGDAFPGSPD